MNNSTTFILQATEGRIAVSCNVPGIDNIRVTSITEESLVCTIHADVGTSVDVHLRQDMPLKIYMHRGPYDSPIFVDARLININPVRDRDFEIRVRLLPADDETRFQMRKAVMRYAMIRLRNSRRALAKISGRHDTNYMPATASASGRIIPIQEVSEEEEIGESLSSLTETGAHKVSGTDSTSRNANPYVPTSMRQLLGDILVQRGLLTEEQLNEFLSTRKSNGRRIGQQLVDAGLISNQLVAEALAVQAGLPFINLRFLDLNKIGGWRFSMRDMSTYKFIPVYATDIFVKIAVANPLDGDILYRLRKEVGVVIKQEIAEEALINKALETLAQRLGPNEKPIQSHKTTVSLAMKMMDVKVHFELFDMKGRPLTANVMHGLMKQIGREALHFVGPIEPIDDRQDVVECIDLIGMEVFLPTDREPLVMVAKPIQLTPLRNDLDIMAYLFEVLLVDIDKYTAIRLTKFRDSL